MPQSSLNKTQKRCSIRTVKNNKVHESSCREMSSVKDSTSSLNGTKLLVLGSNSQERLRAHSVEATDCKPPTATTDYQSSSDMKSLENVTGLKNQHFLQSPAAPENLRNSRNYSHGCGTHIPGSSLNQIVIGNQQLKKSIEINLNPKKSGGTVLPSRSRMGTKTQSIHKQPNQQTACFYKTDASMGPSTAKMQHSDEYATN